MENVSYISDTRSFITIVVLTYNPNWIKLRETLYSIAIQKGVNFDLVISDDGSEEDFFSEAKSFLSHFSSLRTCFLKNEKNVGTVKNLLSVFDKVKVGSFIKTISPGDFFYDENSLLKISNYIMNNCADIYFGNSFYYEYMNGQFFIYDNLRNPKDISPYVERNLSKIRHSYLIHRDYILGSAFIVNTQKLYRYLCKIQNITMYAEDTAIIYMIADNNTILYIDDYLFWYEYGVGISTSNNNLWNQRLYNDNKNVFLLMYQKHVISPSIYYMHYSRFRSFRLLLRLYHDFFYIIRRLYLSADKISISVTQADYDTLSAIKHNACLY